MIKKNVIHHLLPGIHLYIGSYMRSFLCSFVHSLTQFIFFDSCIIHPLLHPFIHSFMNSFIHSCILSFISMNHALEGLSLLSLDVRIIRNSFGKLPSRAAGTPQPTPSGGKNRYHGFLQTCFLYTPSHQRFS